MPHGHSRGRGTVRSRGPSAMCDGEYDHAHGTPCDLPGVSCGHATGRLGVVLQLLRATSAQKLQDHQRFLHSSCPATGVQEAPLPCGQVWGHTCPHMAGRAASDRAPTAPLATGLPSYPRTRPPAASPPHIAHARTHAVCRVALHLPHLLSLSRSTSPPRSLT